jgi:hypothetical protein
MDRNASDAERLKLRSELLQECETMVDEAMAAMEKAPANNIIGGSEWGVQDAVMKAKKRLFEKLVQSAISRADSRIKSSFPPCGKEQGQGDGQEAKKQG